jgi:hypothetical protein
MGVKRDLTDLPTPARTADDAVTPDPDPTFLRPYLDHLVEVNQREGERPHAVEGTRFRHSMAGACSRQVAYHALGVPVSDPMDLAGVVVTGNGTAKHDEIQAVLLDRYGPALRVEVACQPDGSQGSGSADGVLEVDGRRVCWEHKNVGGFAFKMAVGERGKAQGPKHAHLLQAGLNALAADCDDVVITYMTWEAISVGIAQRKGFTEAGRVCAQWTFGRDVWEPLARAEIERVNRILAVVDTGFLPGRSFPDPELPAGNIVTHPPTGGWEHKNADGMLLDAGTFWACGYCRWQTSCSETAAGRQSITEVAVTLGLAGEAA